MINVDFGSVKLSGPKIVIMAELSTLVNTLIKRNFLEKEDVEYSVKIAMMSDAELLEETEKLEEEAKKSEPESSAEKEDKLTSKEEAVDDLIEALKILFS